MTTARQLICSLLACTLLAACDRDGGPPTDVWAKRLGQITARWSAAPGLDLLQGVAVPVRGYLESRFLAESTGDINDVYAGFQRRFTRMSHATALTSVAEIGNQTRTIPRRIRSWATSSTS